MTARRTDPRCCGCAPRTHVRYDGAGHLIRLGVLPTDAQWTGGIALGGDRAAQAAAQRAATADALGFLIALTDRTTPPPPTPAASSATGIG